MKGGIHTTELRLNGFDSATWKPLTTFRTINGCSTRQNKETGEPITYLRFNPNKLTGSCDSLPGYQRSLNYVLDRTGVDVIPELIRIDFKLDYTADSGEYAQYIKTWEALLYCFAVQKKSEAKDRMFSIDPFTGAHKSTKVSSKTFEMELYNKATQKPSESVGYRAELRRTSLDGTKSASQALQSWQALLSKLPAQFEQMQEIMTQRLIDEWTSIKGNIKANKYSINQFIYDRNELIYTRKQLIEVYRRIGTRSPEKAAYNFCFRHSIKFITGNDISSLSCQVIKIIDDYIKGSCVNNSALSNTQ